MIWLTWLQFRAQAITAAAALAAFAILLAATGPHLASLYAASGLSGCHRASCGDLASNFLRQLIPQAPTGCCTCSAPCSSSSRPPSSACSGARR